MPRKRSANLLNLLQRRHGLVWRLQEKANDKEVASLNPLLRKARWSLGQFVLASSNAARVCATR